ncbi:HLA class I histocompatibility antigen, A alpha chain-like [Alosa pseudoharengus]|uniref:HLA class I histocompatibility antigen, A alpha chain-like n=1 Tax=Alosa pseudoharengus TaxID=34774 RepID=UPI003F8C1A7E
MCHVCCPNSHMTYKRTSSDLLTPFARPSRLLDFAEWLEYKVRVQEDDRLFSHSRAPVERQLDPRQDAKASRAIQTTIVPLDIQTTIVPLDIQTTIVPLDIRQAQACSHTHLEVHEVSSPTPSTETEDPAGFHVLQIILGCQLQENEDIGTLTHKDAFNGATGDVRYYNPQSDSLYTDQVWPDAVDGIWVVSVHIAFAYYHPLCIETLKTNLEKEKNRVLKKINPRVRLLQKTLSDSAGALLTCLATGFYPRHINLTLLRDGQPVSDHQITGGELLPNGDETYQMRKSLEVSAEELQHHHYTCTAEHLSLDNKLDISLDHEWDSVTTSIVPSVLIAAGLLCLAGVGVGALVLWRRTRTGRGSQTSLQVNTEASGECARN